MSTRDSGAIARKKQEVEERAAKIRIELGDVPSDVSSEEETLPKNTRGKRVTNRTPTPAIAVEDSSDEEEEGKNDANKSRNAKAATQPSRNQGKRLRARVNSVEGQSLPTDIEDDRMSAIIDELRRAAEEKAKVELENARLRGAAEEKAKVEVENARLHQQLLQMQEAERLKKAPEISPPMAPVANKAENSR
jgi:hypothetical protein